MTFKAVRKKQNKTRRVLQLSSILPGYCPGEFAEESRWSHEK
jgi:hypothetical protein